MSSEDLDKFAEVNPKLNYLSSNTCAKFRKWDFSFADVYPTYDRNHEYLRLSHPCWEPFVAAFMDRVWRDYLEGKSRSYNKVHFWNYMIKNGRIFNILPFFF